MKRRHLLAGAATATALASRARAQSSFLLRIGYLSGRSLKTDSHLLDAFRDGLKTVGYVDGQNVTIDVRWADGHYDRLAAMAVELVATKPSLIAAVGGNAVGLAMKAATSTIPIVFGSAADPIKLGLVNNLSRPDSNLTGMTLWAQELEAKRLDLLREMLPNARRVALLMNPTNPGVADELRSAHEAAGVLGFRLEVLNAASTSEIDRAFEQLLAGKVEALSVASDAALTNQREKIVALAAAHRLPAIFPNREYAVAGGLASYSTRWADMYRVIGAYAGRILKGAQPADLPVQRPTTYELVVNLKTAKTLALALPPSFLSHADEVIE
jgi:putative ABC transport system substrate-binding protein